MGEATARVTEWKRGAETALDVLIVLFALTGLQVAFDHFGVRWNLGFLKGFFSAAIIYSRHAPRLPPAPADLRADSAKEGRR